MRKVQLGKVQACGVGSSGVLMQECFSGHLLYTSTARWWCVRSLTCAHSSSRLSCSTVRVTLSANVTRSLNSEHYISRYRTQNHRTHSVSLVQLKRLESLIIIDVFTAILMNQKFIFINLSVSHHDCFPRPGERLIGSPWLFFSSSLRSSHVRVTRGSQNTPGKSQQLPFPSGFSNR